MKFTEQQTKELEKKLDPANVKARPDSGMSYLEGWHTIAEANRIFGFDGWDRETIELIENTPPTKNSKGNNVVSFRAKVRITVGGIHREGTGFGSGISFDIHTAYEGAIKEAETDAMKRALMTFGNPFGLALYDKTKANVGVDVEPMNGDEFLLLQTEIRESKDMDELKNTMEKVNAAVKRMTPQQKDTLIKDKDKRKDELSKTQTPIG